MKISAKNLVDDVKSGLSDSELLEKYNISASTLVNFFNKLIDAGLLKKSEIDQRKKPFLCPACNKQILENSIECSYCGLIISKYKKSGNAPSPHPPATEDNHPINLNSKQQKQKATIESIIRRGLSYLFGSFFLILGVVALFTEFFMGVSFLVIACILFPPIIDRIQNLTNYQFSSIAKFSVSVVAIFLFGILNTIVNRPVPDKTKTTSSPAIAQKPSANRVTAKKPDPDLEKQTNLEKEKRRQEIEREKLAELNKASADAVQFRKILFAALAADNLNIVQRVYINEIIPRQIIIEMKPIWHARNKHLRKNDATHFWKLWASIHSPNDPDKAMVKLVSINGDEVGGSRIWGGSLIWIEE